ncbi:hypothetical protein [Denitromonas halophila]|uniref:Uncharacterized protein n=1 Tax=Denitromonas halophila TaxID=1629404 RepID=A0A557QXB5_9RHOO|nr:hypothetical protein [Denitromonas halophila]TVO57558.1 hypothetical protein FHP91_07730 [Denitromonas halophila]
MSTPGITLDAIREAAAALAAAHVVTTGIAAQMQDEIRAAIAPVMDRRRVELDTAAAAEAATTARLQKMIDAAPHLFVQPRSVAIDGVKAGYRKGEDTLDWPSDEILIERIHALLPDDLVALLIRSQESLVLDAIPQLDAAVMRQLGINRISGADRSYITVGDSDVEKTAKALIADAMRRQGEDDTPKAKKGKAKAAKAGVAA